MSGAGEGGGSTRIARTNGGGSEELVSKSNETTAIRIWVNLGRLMVDSTIYLRFVFGLSLLTEQLADVKW